MEREEIKKQIAELKKEMAEVHGPKCEVFLAFVVI